MPLKELLDPQGKAVLGGLQNLGIKTVQDVRIGKTIRPIPHRCNLLRSVVPLNPSNPYENLTPDLRLP